MQHLPLDPNEIRIRAEKFKNEWKDAKSEAGERQAFWIAFFEIFNIPVRRVSTWFETRVKITKNISGSIDLFCPGKLLIEHKTKGKDLKKAFGQAIDYLPGVDNSSLPRYILVCDFEKFSLSDMDNPGHVDNFTLSQLPEKIHLFDFISGHEIEETRGKEDPVNQIVARKMGTLHNQLRASGYRGHDLEVILVRILFCLFAEDTAIFKPHQFHNFIKNRTVSDGSDLGAKLSELFQHLNTNPKDILSLTDAVIKDFPYVNGGLFEENIRVGAFNTEMRKVLLDASELDWSSISPEIFGALFQSVLDEDEQHADGAHYTSERNIRKLINPLFMDDLWEEFESVKANRTRLDRFHEKLGGLTFLDPACGCGNFLVVTYRELRKLELEVIRILRRDNHQLSLDVANLVKVKASNFGGIEINEFPARIAEVAMWLIDHQMNLQMENEFGQSIPDIPLKPSANIVSKTSALKLDWRTVLGKLPTYIIGNPPFLGHHLQTPEQKAEMQAVLHGIQGNGVLDYVSAWFFKAAEYIQNTETKVAFVSTNSITQGEQVVLLWNSLFNRFGAKIIFAHRTFKWNNDSPGSAAVFCVIVGFSHTEPKKKTLFDYADVRDKTPTSRVVKNINAYLVDFDNVFVTNQRNPICDIAPKMVYGSKPSDGKNFTVRENEYAELKEINSEAIEYIKPYLGSKEYLHSIRRYCIWLADSQPSKFRHIQFIQNRLAQVKSFREASDAESTRNYPYHHLFRQLAQPKGNYLLVPRHSSESRLLIPFGYFDCDTIVSDACFSVPNANTYHFGILQSQMHMAWVRTVCGRLKADYRYSKDIVYNNFAWPENPTDAQIETIKKCAEEVLAAREEANDTPDGMYRDPMPARLIKAHKALDKAVDAAYRKKPFETEGERVAFLFDRYRTLTAPLAGEKTKKKAPKKKPAV